MNTAQALGLLALIITFFIIKYGLWGDLRMNMWANGVLQNWNGKLSRIFISERRPILIGDYIRDNKVSLGILLLSFSLESFIITVSFFGYLLYPTNAIHFIIFTVFSFCLISSLARLILVALEIRSYDTYLGEVESDMAFIFLKGSTNDVNNAIVRVEDHEGPLVDLIHLMAKELDKNGYINSRESALCNKV